MLYETPQPSAPFAELNARGFAHLANVRFWSGEPLTTDLSTISPTGPPDVVVVSSWGVPAYLRAARALPPHTLRLVAVDSPWRSSIKQWGGRVTHRRLLARAFDGAWIAGAPQWELVRRLGFQSAQILEHVYCCDTELFSGGSTPQERHRAPFLFAGRLVAEKGVRQLAEAFTLFRNSTGSTRSLRVVGNGPIRVRGDGITVHPFADPPELRSLMDRSCALVNPAFIEHWGVSAHEAASMGLPLILSRTVGAGSRFLHAGISGLHGGPDVRELVAAFAEIDCMDIENYSAMAAASARLGSLLDLKAWVHNLERGVARLRAVKRRPRT